MDQKELNTIAEVLECLYLLTKGKFYPISNKSTENDELNDLIALANTLTEDIKELYEYAIPLSQGNLSIERPKKTNFLASSLKELHSRLLHLTWQAQQIAKGDYAQRVDYMGEFSEAFNKMADMLSDREQSLKNEIEERKSVEAILKEKNDSILESMTYAKMIQHSLLPDDIIMSRCLSEFFVFYEQKDIVGGDFYWFRKMKDGLVLALFDCTGHGVYGALMTMTVNAVLQRIVEEGYCQSPASVISELNRKVKSTMNAYDSSNKLHNGLDIGICMIFPESKKLIYSGSKLSLFIANDGIVKEIRGDRQSVGYRKSHVDYVYKDHEITWNEKTAFYMTTDGFLDQNGVEDIYGFGIHRFTELIQKNSNEPMQVQAQTFKTALKDFMGDEEQRDDIALIGFRMK